MVEKRLAYMCCLCAAWVACVAWVLPVWCVVTEFTFVFSFPTAAAVLPEVVRWLVRRLSCSARQVITDKWRYSARYEKT